MIRTTLCALALLCLAGVEQSHARDSLPAALSAEAPGLTRRGTGTYRWMGLEVYIATLWTGRAPVNFERPLALSLRYARSLRGSAIAERSAQEIERLALATPEQLDAWRRAMAGLFPDVVQGTTLTGLLMPERGARFFRDGEPLGEIADPAFARAFFSIWLHPNTAAPALRAALLGDG